MTEFVEYLVAQSSSMVKVQILSFTCHPPKIVVLYPPIGLRAGKSSVGWHYTVLVVSGPRRRMFRNAGRNIANDILSIILTPPFVPSLPHSHIPTFARIP